ncbi:hypothetical protein EV702DRAFT_1266410 [Suillus placidus]|uniref:Uncharacterized protein n=1 Tax=Suillus placidus TaxID=48579 RepID=A0A9P7A461_9AGAM|nr:hypothetical protein EV702DRAFT_1266410 [Suillus placidus]
MLQCSLICRLSSVSVCSHARCNSGLHRGRGWGLLDTLISALVEPVLFGVDGEMDKDERILLGESESDPDPTFHSRIRLLMLMLTTEVHRILYTFATSCNGVFSAVQKCSSLGGIPTTQREENLNFGLTSGEWEGLSGAVKLYGLSELYSVYGDDEAPDIRIIHKGWFEMHQRESGT